MVEPHGTKVLNIVENQDLCTLIVGTPYGINSYRLLVRGRCVDNAANAQDLRITADVVLSGSILVAFGIAIPVLLAFLIAFLIPRQLRKIAGILCTQTNKERGH